MPRGAKIRTGVIIAIIIAVIILLILLLLGGYVVIKKVITNTFATSEDTNYLDQYNYTNYNYTDYYNNSENNYEDYYTDYYEDLNKTISTEEKEYKTSDELTTLNFYRRIVYNPDPELEDSLDITINITISGYLEEKDPTKPGLAEYGDRVYVFKDGEVNWDINANEKSDGDICVINWDVYSEDSSSADNLAFVYDINGFQSRQPELGLKGKLEIPLTKRTTIELFKQSENVDPICNGYTENTVLSEEKTTNAQFPITLINVNIDNLDYSGNLESEGDSYDIPSGANAAFLGGGMDVLLDMPFEDEIDPWKITWDIHLP